MVPSTGPAYVNDPHDTIVQADIKLWPFKAMAGIGSRHLKPMNRQSEEKVIPTNLDLDELPR